MFRERHIETRHAGDLVAVDTFFVGHLKGVGKVYLQTVVDCHSRYAWGRLYPTVTAIHVMNNDVLPTFEAHEARISTVLSDNGREYCGRPDRHPFELFLQLEETGPVKEIGGVVQDDQLWILDSLDQLALVRRLERDFPTIEEADYKVGIGVATGADKALTSQFEDLAVEEDRKLPLAVTRDIISGHVEWRGLGIVNPFADEGGLVDLEDYPRLRAYLEARKDQIAKRHVAQKTPTNWYRTIDRIHPALANTPKLLIPDIKGEAHIVYENGRLYPHHNLYFITAEDWDLRALQAVLRSGIARLFVSTYSTRMRGGYLRFQAKYLRRIRVPRWQVVSRDVADQLTKATREQNTTTCNEAVFALYGLSLEERAALGGNGVGQEDEGVN